MKSFIQNIGPYLRPSNLRSWFTGAFVVPTHYQMLSAEFNPVEYFRMEVSGMSTLRPRWGRSCSRRGGPGTAAVRMLPANLHSRRFAARCRG
jgi:hypothetical protein